MTHQNDTRIDRHDCRFEWCINTDAASEQQLLEHFGRVEGVPATARSLAGLPGSVGTVSVGCSWSEDTEPAPIVFVMHDDGVHDSTIQFMRLDEAIELRNMLTVVIEAAASGLRIDTQGVPR